MTTVRAQFDGKVLIPLEPLDYEKGQMLEIDIRQTDGRPAIGVAPAVNPSSRCSIRLA
jgi:hypothetical protein